MPGSEERAVDVGRTSVRLVIAGTGTPAALFSAALGTPLEAWSLVAPTVAQQARVILWDRPGVGRSGPGVVRTAADTADAMATVLDAVNAGPVVVVGHSRGGIDGLALALCRPELVAGLVFVESSHPDQPNRMKLSDGAIVRVVRILARVPRPVAYLVAVVLRAVVHALAPRSRKGMHALADVAPVLARRLDGFVAEYAAAPGLLADVSRGLSSRSFPDVPITVLTGDDNFNDPSDQATWSQMHAELAALAPYGQHIHVSCGHEMPFARPDAVVAAIGDLLAHLAPPPD